MIAEILSTGDEIRSGALVDSNTAYIAEKLEEIGVEVVRHNSTGDNLQVMTDVLLEISKRADVAIVTGGLGPTTDDITAEAAAKAMGVKLVLNESALSDIRAMFAKFKRPMSSSNEKQAMLPQGADCLRNPIGTAPGFSLKIGRCTFFFAPGVPLEMKKMLADHILPAVSRITGSRSHSMVKSISTFGLGESVVGEKVAAITKEFKDIQLGLRATFPETYVKLYIRGEDENRLQDTLAKATEWVQDKLGQNVLSTEGYTMEKVVGDLLRSKGATLAIAESCTGGLVASLITDVAGSSEYFLFSGVTYSNDSKIRVLGVRPETIEAHGAVSEETVREMAEGARRISGATYGLATSGIAGPDGGSEDKPVGTVCIALAAPQATTAKRFLTPYGKLYHSYGSRLLNKRWFAIMALEMLRRELIGIKM